MVIKAGLVVNSIIFVNKLDCFNNFITKLNRYSHKNVYKVQMIDGDLFVNLWIKII